MFDSKQARRESLDPSRSPDGPWSERLPASLPEPLIVTNPPAMDRAGRILVVEPDRERREVLETLLLAEGYEFKSLRDPDEMLAFASFYQPDLVLLAVELPGTSGVELCGELRARDPSRGFPIVLLGDSGDEGRVVGGLMAGADDFVSTPFRVQELRARIRVQLRNKHFLDALDRLRSERDVLRRDAQLDPLTGLLNRRSFERAAQQALGRREPFGVLFMDLDHFKSVNDRFGHDMGDRVLRAVAKLLRRQLRPGDAVGRYGGEEFVAIVRGAGRQATELVAERVRVAAELLKLPERGPERVTLSIGASVFDPDLAAESPNELFHRADAALYAAKNAGRNRVVVLPERESTRVSAPPDPAPCQADAPSTVRALGPNWSEDPPA